VPTQVIDTGEMSTEHNPDAPLVGPRGEEPVSAAAEPAVYDGESGAVAEPGTSVESAPEAESASPAVAEPPAPEPAVSERPAPSAPAEERPYHAPSSNMLPQRERRRSVFERLIVRLIATCGIVGIGVAIGAIMVSSNSQGWIVGLVVSIVTVILAGLLWSSRML
jgi:hypothetical protein